MITLFKKREKGDLLQNQDATVVVPATKLVEPEYYYDALLQLFPTAYNRLKMTCWLGNRSNGYRAVAENIELTGNSVCKKNNGIWWLPYPLLHNLCQQEEDIPYWMYYEKHPYDAIIQVRKFKNDYDPIFSKWPFSYVYWIYKTEFLGDEIGPLVANFQTRPDLLRDAKPMREKIVYILTPDTITIGVVKNIEHAVPILRKKFKMEYFVALETIKIAPTPVRQSVLKKENIMEYYLTRYEDLVEDIFENDWSICTV